MFKFSTDNMCFFRAESLLDMSRNWGWRIPTIFCQNAWRVKIMRNSKFNLHAVKDFYSTCSNSSAINTCPRCETNILPYIPIPLYEFMASYPPVLRRNFLNICQQIKLKWQPKTEVNFARPIVYILYSSSLSLSLIIMAFVTNAQATS